MKRLLALLAVATVAALAFVGGASAHPLGNFTVNRYAGIEVPGERSTSAYALDLAEIPTFQPGPGSRCRLCGALARELELFVDGRRSPLRVARAPRHRRPGAGGLKTLRLDVVYRAAGSGDELAFADRRFPARIGWREVTLAARDGARDPRVDRALREALATSCACTQTIF